MAEIEEELKSLLMKVKEGPPGDLPNPGIQPRSPTMQADSLPGRLPLLQGIFLIQELNWGLLHCWQILYQLS